MNHSVNVVFPNSIRFRLVATSKTTTTTTFVGKNLFWCNDHGKIIKSKSNSLPLLTTRQGRTNKLKSPISFLHVLKASGSNRDKNKSCSF